MVSCSHGPDSAAPEVEIPAINDRRGENRGKRAQLRGEGHQVSDMNYCDMDAYGWGGRERERKGERGGGSVHSGSPPAA